MGRGVTLTALGNDFLNAATISDSGLMRLAFGKQVDRATADLPAGTTAPLFTIAGGPILLVQILGIVTTVIQTQACNTKLQANPTATGTSVDICANLDITAKAVASFFGITGTVTDAMVNALAIRMQITPVICPVGTIDLVTAATNTGQVQWSLWYVPMLASGVSVVAA
jgi:hypothetical protein